MTISELDELLHKRFDITRDDFVAALKTLPSVRPWASILTEDEARLLDDADFAEEPRGLRRRRHRDRQRFSFLRNLLAQTAKVAQHAGSAVGAALDENTGSIDTALADTILAAVGALQARGDTDVTATVLARWTSTQKCSS